MNYYKRHIGDYHKKAGRLSMLEHGAYTLLMDACYDREKFPTKDEALDWCWARTEQEIAAVEFVLSKFFIFADGVYTQNHILESVERYHENAEKNKQIAIEREEKRKAARERTVDETARTVDESPPNHKPLTNNHKPLTTIKDKDISQQAGRFTPPTVEGVDSYMQSIHKGSYVEAEKFVDFYASKGWMVGKNKMKDWKAAVRNWTKSESVKTIKGKSDLNQIASAHKEFLDGTS